MKRHIILILAFVLTLLPIATTSAQGNPDALVYSLVGGDITTLNLALIADQSSGAVAGQLMASLFRPDPDTAEPKPWLATWESSADGLTYTFTLKDAKWSDGQPITSKDVEFTFNAIRSDKVQSPRKADLSLASKLEVKDAKTFVVTLKKPDCTVWGSVFVNLIPLPSQKFKEDFSDFMTNPWNTKPDVVSGPYLFDDRKPGEYVRLKANPTYFEGQAKIPTIVFRIIADPATVNQALQTDTIDYAFMYPDQLEQLQGKDKVNAYLWPNNNTPILVMNYQDSENPQPAYDKDGKPNQLKPNKFFADKRVRQAVAMGYDKSALTQTLGKDSGSVQLTGPVTPAWYAGYDMSMVQPWPYDPKKAAELLDEAGWKMGPDGVRVKDGVKFEVKLVYSKLVDLWSNIATVLQDQLKDLGIQVDVSEMEWSAYLQNVLLPFKYDMTVVGFGGGIEVDGIAYNLLYSKNATPSQGFNMAAYVNPKMDDLLDQARSIPGCKIADRVKLYQQIQQIARDDVAYDWTVSTTAVYVLNKRVTGGFGVWAAKPEIREWTLGK